MPTLHDAPHRDAIRCRVQALRPDMMPLWGRMRVDQMLRHVNAGLASAIGELKTSPKPIPLPRALMRTLVLHLPWPKGAPTAPEFLVPDRYEFDAERDRCLQLIDRVAARPIDGAWPAHPAFGAMTGRHWGRLQSKHLSHHLTQFGV